MVYEELPVEIRFHSPDDPVLGPRGEEARQLAFPGDNFASEIEYAGRTWSFVHTDLLQGPNDSEPTRQRLVYREIRRDT
jgi:hypothetical protein